MTGLLTVFAGQAIQVGQDFRILFVRTSHGSPRFKLLPGTPTDPDRDFPMSLAGQFGFEIVKIHHNSVTLAVTAPDGYQISVEPPVLRVPREIADA